MRFFCHPYRFYQNGILDCDFYNFDETRLIMGMIVTPSNRCGKLKLFNLLTGNG